MKEFDVTNNHGSYKLYLPTNVKEVINNDYFLKVTEGIELPDEHSLIALAYREKLSIVLNTTSKARNQGTAVIPMFVKNGPTNSKYIDKLKANTPIIIDGTDIARGHHVNIKKNFLSIGAVQSLCKNTKVANDSIKDPNEYYFVEFKIIPNCDIHGNYPSEDIPYNSPFLVEDNSNLNTSVN